MLAAIAAARLREEGDDDVLVISTPVSMDRVAFLFLLARVVGVVEEEDDDDCGCGFLVNFNVVARPSSHNLIPQSERNLSWVHTFCLEYALFAR